MALGLNEIQRIRRIFEAKGWPINEGEIPEQKDLFNNFCNLIDRLGDEEKELILLISNDFIKIDVVAYLLHLNRAFFSIPAELYKDRTHIFCVPAMPPKQIGRIKSPSIIPYQFQHLILRQQEETKNKKIVSYDSLEYLTKNHAKRSNSILFLMDDFVGTGETLLQTLEHYNDNHKVPDEIVLVVCIACLSIGIKALHEFGYGLFFSIMQKRGISDSIRVKNKLLALSTMDKMERRLMITPLEKHGYMNSEGLISLIRTPDNTFPVFWCPTTRSHEKWPAPFPR